MMISVFQWGRLYDDLSLPIRSIYNDLHSRASHWYSYQFKNSSESWGHQLRWYDSYNTYPLFLSLKKLLRTKKVVHEKNFQFVRGDESMPFGSSKSLHPSTWAWSGQIRSPIYLIGFQFLVSYFLSFQGYVVWEFKSELVKLIFCEVQHFLMRSNLEIGYLTFDLWPKRNFDPIGTLDFYEI